jgi:hypothetical protein
LIQSVDMVSVTNKLFMRNVIMLSVVMLQEFDPWQPEPTLEGSP